MCFDQLTKCQGIINPEDDVVYSAEEVREFAQELHDLGSGNWLAISSDKDKFIYNFAMFSFYSRDVDGAEEYWSRIFEGTGPSSSLREFRHTWWGEGDGYVFYLPIDATIKALTILKKYFD
jgi:hypothetical protein